LINHLVGLLTPQYSYLAALPQHHRLRDVTVPATTMMMADMTAKEQVEL
jgi:hypothetical protein